MVHEGDRRHAAFMANADLVVHDAQYTAGRIRIQEDLGHSSYEYAVEVAAAAGIKRIELTHHDPEHNDLFIADIEQRARAVAEKRGSPLEVFCAHEAGEYYIRGEQIPSSGGARARAGRTGAPVAGSRLPVLTTIRCCAVLR